jgi:tetratricopeptide (TPR) repeat protein
MNIIKIIFIVIFLSLIISQESCATAINEKNAILHANTADANQKSGDWKAARTEWARAVVNADLGKMDNKVRAIFYYEYGRSLGVTCIYDEAEVYLNKALELDRKTGEPLYLSLTELSRLFLDQKKYEKAANYYVKSFNELDKRNGEKEAPIEYANMLDEYALALSKIGETAKSDEAKLRAIKFRKENPKGYSVTERTPYGTQFE